MSVYGFGRENGNCRWDWKSNHAFGLCGQTVNWAQTTAASRGRAAMDFSFNRDDQNPLNTGCGSLNVNVILGQRSF